MTPDLNRRWINGEPPFDGVTLSLASDDLVALPELLQGLRHLVDELERTYGERLLHSAADWHEHDGYLSEARPISWREFRSWLVSDDALQAAGQGDAYVRTAVLPENAEFYLRIYIPDAGDTDYAETRGNFDLTCSAEVAECLTAALETPTALRLTGEPAKRFFDRSYGG